jgi:hypothetical protein
MLGPHVETTVYRCSGCGETAVHVECWEGDDVPHGLPAELMRCECGGGYVRVESGRTK